MIIKSLKYPLIISMLIFTAACNKGPKIIQPELDTAAAKQSSNIFSVETSDTPSLESGSEGFTEDLHTVIVNEILPTSKYIYVNVTEAGNSFWIATRKQEVEIGKTYFYKGGLLKTNFESKEYNRVFDKIYLVSNIVPEKHGNNTNPLGEVSETEEPNEASTPTEIPSGKMVPQKGSITISEIVKNPSKYEGKTVQLTGKCTKINPNIMNRNWIHLKDGSMDEYDLVITSDTFVAEGKTITIQAVVGLNRDFGAGYTYALILENGKVIE